MDTETRLTGQVLWEGFRLGQHVVKAAIDKGQKGEFDPVFGPFREAYKESAYLASDPSIACILNCSWNGRISLSCRTPPYVKTAANLN